ncbi:hypothetical protein JTE90_017751 [Oedothorax gibbosus]|uniref:V-type proton ATPase proteolipid subunit n=1 Tax=Oedothorax gibbosus TaxID=931172 RepID=A0AAV6UKZ1_9ARAC|nr:hypothetical protein JTE90_017751 [Oedothorax gibbosus]
MAKENEATFDMQMMVKNQIYSPFFGVIGASMSMIFTAYGAAYGTWKAGVSISTAGTIKPDIIIKSLLPVVMASIISIYGLVASVLIANAIKSTSDGYTLFKGLLHLGSGITVGVTGLSAGWAIGDVGAEGVRDVVHQSALFVGMVLILIFCEVLGLYGLIVGLILCTKE